MRYNDNNNIVKNISEVVKMSVSLYECKSKDEPKRYSIKNNNIDEVTCNYFQ